MSSPTTDECLIEVYYLKDFQWVCVLPNQDRIVLEAGMCRYDGMQAMGKAALHHATEAWRTKDYTPVTRDEALIQCQEHIDYLKKLSETAKHPKNQSALQDFLARLDRLFPK